ncbi:hypothetical protein CapIbe_007513 [Capra ibex]
MHKCLVCDRGYSGEKHYENMRRSTMENPTNVSDAYENSTECAGSRDWRAVALRQGGRAPCKQLQASLIMPFSLGVLSLAIGKFSKLQQRLQPRRRPAKTVECD